MTLFRVRCVVVVLVLFAGAKRRREEPLYSMRVRKRVEQSRFIPQRQGLWGLFGFWRVRTHHVLCIGALGEPSHFLRLCSCQTYRDARVFGRLLSLFSLFDPSPLPPSPVFSSRFASLSHSRPRPCIHTYTPLPYVHIPIFFLSALVKIATRVSGASSALSPPPGSVHPAELLEECALDGETLLRLTREGWLELSPAAPPMYVLFVVLYLRDFVWSWFGIFFRLINLSTIPENASVMAIYI